MMGGDYNIMSIVGFLSELTTSAGYVLTDSFGEICCVARLGKEDASEAS
jgi:hypothetical protein